MTVVKLSDIICQIPCKELKFKQLRGLRVVIDANWVLHYATKSIRGFRSKTGKCTSHYRTVIGICQQLGFPNVCWVFDSVANAAKTEELQRREISMATAESKESFVGAPEDSEESLIDSDDEFLNALSASASTVSQSARYRNQDRIRLADNVIPDTKRILDILGVTWLDAPAGIEAECTAAWMTQRGIADAVYSKDADCFPLGAKMIIVPQKGNSETGKFNLYLIEDVYTYLRHVVDTNRTVNSDNDDEVSVLTPEISLKIICMALGTDWDRSGIKKIGPKTILKKWNNVVDKYYSAEYKHLRDLCKIGYTVTESQEQMLTTSVMEMRALGLEGHEKPTWDLDARQHELLKSFLQEGTFAEKSINAVFNKITKLAKSWKPSGQSFTPMTDAQMLNFLAPSD